MNYLENDNSLNQVVPEIFSSKDNSELLVVWK